MQTHPVVTNAGPLIYLAVVSQFELLKQLFGVVYLPQAVYQEIVVHGRGRPGASETNTAVAEGWLKRIVVEDRIAVDSLLDELHIGEAEAIVLAQELEVGKVLLDDRQARTKAQLMGLAVTGTVGILLLAKHTGIIGDIRQELNRLRASNFRFSQDLYDRLTSSSDSTNYPG